MAKDHGPSVKDDKQYEGLRKKGMSKERAAKIANTPDASEKGGKNSHGGGSSQSSKSSGSRQRREPRPEAGRRSQGRQEVQSELSRGLLGGDGAGYGSAMPSLIERITQVSRSKQGRSLIRQVQDRLTASPKSGRGARGGRSRNRGR